MKYKCPICHLQGFETEVCPDCGYQQVLKMCPEDKLCTCNHDIHEGIRYCLVCGEAVCPGCGSHDCFQISRVTGYLQDVAGMNAAKQQEVKDRKRYSV
jgi:hypothetical protein